MPAFHAATLLRCRAMLDTVAHTTCYAAISYAATLTLPDAAITALRAADMMLLLMRHYAR